MADPSSSLAKDEVGQNTLRLDMANRLEGRFEYTLARGMYDGSYLVCMR